MADCPETVSAARVVAILGATSGITPAVTGLLLARVTADDKDLVLSDEFFQGLETVGPWAHVKDPIISDADWEGHYQYAIPIHVWHGYEKGASASLATVRNTNFAIRAALINKANYSPVLVGKGNVPFEISCERVVQDDENLQGEFVEYVITPKFYAALN